MTSTDLLQYWLNQELITEGCLHTMEATLKVADKATIPRTLLAECRRQVRIAKAKHDHAKAMVRMMKGER